MSHKVGQLLFLEQEAQAGLAHLLAQQQQEQLELLGRQPERLLTTAGTEELEHPAAAAVEAVRQDQEAQEGMQAESQAERLQVGILILETARTVSTIPTVRRDQPMGGLDRVAKQQTRQPKRAEMVQVDMSRSAGNNDFMKRLLTIFALMPLLAFGQGAVPSGASLPRIGYAGKLIGSVIGATDITPEPPPAGAISYRLIAETNTTLAVPDYVVAQHAAPTNSALLLAAVWSASLVANESVAPTNITGFGVNWIQIGSTNYDKATNALHTLSLWRSMTNNTPATTALTVQHATQRAGCAAYFLEFTGVDTGGTYGSGAIVQAVFDALNSTANPSLTMAAISSTNNAAVAFFGNDSNPFTGEPEAGWTELWDVGYLSPGSGHYVMIQSSATDETPSVTAASQDWAGVAVEVKAQ